MTPSKNYKQTSSSFVNWVCIPYLHLDLISFLQVLAEAVFPVLEYGQAFDTEEKNKETEANFKKKELILGIKESRKHQQGSPCLWWSSEKVEASASLKNQQQNKSKNYLYFNLLLCFL